MSDEQVMGGVQEIPRRFLETKQHSCLEDVENIQQSRMNLLIREWKIGPRSQ